ncbi:MAG: mechanosensitive ion channel family protein [Oscillatoriales cyanobacterium SM2_1_8]|nr:mechanosensitive ion channel family protein [Oscillatoriales cyanobacterium SM2_1_8]
MNDLVQSGLDAILQAGLRVIAAIVLFFIGRQLIGFASGLVLRSLRAQRLEPTILGYIGSTLSVTLNIVLIVAILGFFGIETTSFAALLAAAGVAIGAAWSGLLANFAAGAFLIVLQPFKAGDLIGAGGVLGTVQEIGLFVTSVVTPDNVLTYVGNNKLFADNIQNFSANPYRRVDLVAQLAHGVNHQEVIRQLRDRLGNVPNVLTTPAPDLEILEFTLAGPVLAVRPYCANAHYWQVYFDTNRIIREVGTEGNLPVPQQHWQVQQVS